MKPRIVDRVLERKAGRIHVYKAEVMWWVWWWTSDGIPQFEAVASFVEAVRMAGALAAERLVEGCAE